MVTILYKDTRNISLIYLLLPFLIFLLSWIKPVISVPCFILLLLAVHVCLRKEKGTQKKVELSVAALVCIVIAAAFWCWSAGIGGFFYQSPDHHFRNAVFRDLLYEKWPVIYKNYGSGLIYYIGIWIVPALLGKTLLWMGLSKEIAWTVSETALMLWCSLGVILLITLLCLYFQLGRMRDIVVLMMILIGFSGLDIVGEIWKNGLDIHDHIEWWSGYFQFRSNTTSIFWAYNQAVPGWIMTMLLLSEENLNRYGLILGSALFYAPFAVIGIGLCVAAIMLDMFWKEHREGKKKEFWQSLFSPANVIAVLVILPIMSAYYSCNAGCGLNVRFLWEDYGGFTGEIWKTWIGFFFLEAGVYICLVAKNKYREPLYYAVIFTLMAGSVLAVGERGEVVFRISATMPALFVLMCFVMEAIFGRKKQQGAENKVCAVMISLLLALGFVTPLVEYGRAIAAMQERGRICAVADDLKTLNSEEAPLNFIGLYISDSFFYQYMMR